MEQPKIFLISMDTELGAERRSRLNYDYEWFKASESGKALKFIKDKMIHYWSSKEKNRNGKEGCFDSYYRLLTKIYNEKIDDLFILEDDCFIKNDELLEFCKNKPKEICYLNGDIKELKKWKNYNDFSKQTGVNNIEEDFKILGTWGIYIPNHQLVKKIIDTLDNLKRYRAIDITFCNKRIITKYYYPSITLLNDFGVSSTARLPCNSYDNYVKVRKKKNLITIYNGFNTSSLFRFR